MTLHCEAVSLENIIHLNKKKKKKKKKQCDKDYELLLSQNSVILTFKNKGQVSIFQIHVGNSNCHGILIQNFVIFSQTATSLIWLKCTYDVFSSLDQDQVDNLHMF